MVLRGFGTGFISWSFVEDDFVVSLFDRPGSDILGFVDEDVVVSLFERSVLEVGAAAKVLLVAGKDSLRFCALQRYFTVDNFVPAFIESQSHSAETIGMYHC